MGGQACVFYGAAEFSRDTDLALLASSANLDRFRAALARLGAAARGTRTPSPRPFLTLDDRSRQVPAAA